MATAKQIEANRRNAQKRTGHDPAPQSGKELNYQVERVGLRCARVPQKSTGPKTEEGKQRSRLNALKHGLGAIHVPLPHENPNELAETLAGLMDTYQPANAQEQMLVHNIASAFLRIQRASRFEAAILHSQVLNLKGKHSKSLAPDSSDDIGIVIAMANGDFEKAWQLLDRYEKRAQSAYYRAIEILRKLQNDRRREPLRQIREEQAKESYRRKTVAPLSPVPPASVASFGPARKIGLFARRDEIDAVIASRPPDTQAES